MALSVAGASLLEGLAHLHGDKLWVHLRSPHGGSVRDMVILQRECVKVLG